MIQESINLLGRLGKDKITGFKGVIDSVCFDLYGCVQLSLKPTTQDKDGKLRDSYWLDVNRVEIVRENPVMPVPKFAAPGAAPAAYEHGAADKPTQRG